MQEKKTARTKPITKGAESRVLDPSLVGITFNEKNLKIHIQEYQNHFESQIIGKDWTYVAFKNLNSYAIGTDEQGLKVFQNNVQIYSKSFSAVQKRLDSITYVDHLNCYLLNFNCQIYRKDIDDRPPYFFMDGLNSYLKPATCLNYSRAGKRLIVSKGSHNISVVNLDRKRIEMQIIRNQLADIKSIRLFGSKENKIVCLTQNGFLYLCSLSYERKKVCAENSHQIELIRHRNEEGYSVAVCEAYGYILADIIGKIRYCSSRMILFKTEGHSLTKLVVLDEYEQGINQRSTIEFWGCVGKHILWVGLSESGGYVHLYDYDDRRGKLKELIEKWVNHLEVNPFRIHLIDDKFYYTGERGKIMELAIRI